MTSRKSFFNLILISIKNNLWSVALSCIAFMFAMPVYAALYTSIIKNRMINGDYNVLGNVSMSDVYDLHVVGESNILMYPAVIILAMVIGISGFSYLFSKQKVDLYHSLPVRRGDYYAANYISGIIIYIVPYVFFLLLRWIVGQANGFVTADTVKLSLFMMFVHLLGFLAVYTTSIIVVMLTGKVLVAVVGDIVVLAYGIVFCELMKMCMDTFYITHSSYTKSDYMYYTSPVAGYIGLIDGMDSYHGIYNVVPARYVAMIVFVIVASVIGYYLYTVRPSETAGKSMAFKVSMPIVSIMLLVAFSIFGGMGLSTFTAFNGTVRYGWLVFGCVIAIVIGHMVVQAVYYSDFRSLFKDLLNPGIAVVITAIIMVIFIKDLTGYDRYMPRDAAYESAAVASYSLSGGIEYYDLNALEDEFGYRPTWISSEEYRMNHMKLTDKELVREFVAAALMDTREYYSIKDNNAQYTPDLDKYINVTVSYDMRGSKVYRNYYINSNNHIDLFNKLYSSTEYKEGVFDILTAEDEEFDDVRFVGVFGDCGVKLTKEQMLTLVKTYREELLKQNVYELASEVPVGYIYQNYEMEMSGYLSQYSLYKGYVYPSFVKTMKLLADYGIDVNEYRNIENVEKITVTNYHAYENYEGDSDTKEYTDAKSIADIYGAIVPVELADANAPFTRAERIDVQVLYKDTPEIYQYAISHYFLEGQMPEYVMNDVNYDPDAVYSTDIIYRNLAR